MTCKSILQFWLIHFKSHFMYIPCCLKAIGCFTTIISISDIDEITSPTNMTVTLTNNKSQPSITKEQEELILQQPQVKSQLPWETPVEMHSLCTSTPQIFPCPCPAPNLQGSHLILCQFNKKCTPILVNDLPFYVNTDPSYHSYC